MRTAPWLLTSMFALTLVACGDDKNDTTTNETTTGTPGTETSNGTTAEPTTVEPTTGTPTTVEPTTVEPTTVEPTTVEPTTVDPTTGEPGTTTDNTTGMVADYTCEDYCALWVTGCDDFDQYEHNTDICLAQCKQWPIGTPADTTGDTLGCRFYHVGVANQADANVHCPHAGKNGADTCVDADAPKCATYCSTYLANCKDKLNAYKDEADCLAQCAPWYQGEPAETTRDTVGCREYHAGVAKGDPVTHCPHAGPGGAMVCVLAP